MSMSADSFVFVSLCGSENVIFEKVFSFSIEQGRSASPSDL